MSHQIAYRQNENVQSQNLKGVKRAPMLLLLLFIFRDHF